MKWTLSASVQYRIAWRFIINGEAREIIRLVASLCLCACPSSPVWTAKSPYETESEYTLTNCGTLISWGFQNFCALAVMHIFLNCTESGIVLVHLSADFRPFLTNFWPPIVQCKSAEKLELSVGGRGVLLPTKSSENRLKIACFSPGSALFTHRQNNPCLSTLWDIIHVHVRNQFQFLVHHVHTCMKFIVGVWHACDQLHVMLLLPASHLIDVIIF